LNATEWITAKNLSLTKDNGALMLAQMFNVQLITSGQGLRIKRGIKASLFSERRIVKIQTKMPTERSVKLCTPGLIRLKLALRLLVFIRL